MKGLSYSSDSHKGTTNTQGAFYYEADEEITFSIGSIVLESTKGEKIISPLQLVIGADSFGFPHTIHLYYVKEPIYNNDIEIDGLPNSWSLYVEVGDNAQQVGGTDENNPIAARFIMHFGTDGKLSSDALLIVNNWTPIYNNITDSARPLGPDNSSAVVNDPPSSSNFEIDVAALKFGESL